MRRRPPSRQSPVQLLRPANFWGAVIMNVLSKRLRAPYGRRPPERFWLYVILYVALYLVLFFSAAICRADDPTPAPAPCAGQLSLWTPVEHTAETHQWIQPAARVEARCTLTPATKLFIRGDMYTMPGKSQPDIENVGAYEGWLGASLTIYRSVSAAAFVGLHGSFTNGTLQGGTSRSLCGGFRIDTSTDYTVAGVCDAYKPLGPGAAVVFTNVVTVKGAVGVATNVAYIPSTGRRLFAAGPTVSWR